MATASTAAVAAVYTLAHLSLRKLLTRVPNVNERVRREVIYARTCTRVTRTLVRITSRRTLTSESDRISGCFIPVSRERGREGETVVAF